MQEKLSLLWNIIRFDSDSKDKKLESILQERFWSDELFEQGIDNLFDPYLMCDMQKAVDRIKRAKEKAEKVAEKIKNEFLKKGGLITTTTVSEQQWDAPNGWAPLQWMAYVGLKNYGFTDLSEKIQTNWLTLNEKVFATEGKFTEKYNVSSEETTGGGEYPNQDGFGWTNGVYLAMKHGGLF